MSDPRDDEADDPRDVGTDPHDADPHDDADSRDDEPSDDDDGDWRFSLTDLEEEDAEQRRRHRPIEPGSPSVENVVFVLLGVVLMLWVLFGGI